MTRKAKPSQIVITVLLFFVVNTSILFARIDSKPFPADVSTFTLVVAEKGLKKLSMVPTGVRTDDKTRFIYSGHQKGGNVSMFLAGIPGLIASSEINSQRGAKRLAAIELNEGNLVEEMATAAVRAAFADSESIQISEEEGTYVLQITPYATIIQSKKNGTKLHAMLIVNLYDSNNLEKPIWGCPFYGETNGKIDEATLTDPDLLYQRLRQGFERAAWGFARIALNDFDTYETITAEGWLAWFKRPGSLPAIRLQVTEENTLLRLPFGGVFAGSGYNTVNTTSLKTKPLKKLKDKYKSDFER